MMRRDNNNNNKQQPSDFCAQFYLLTNGRVSLSSAAAPSVAVTTSNKQEGLSRRPPERTATIDVDRRLTNSAADGRTRHNLQYHTSVVQLCC
jgi:hypothetical protein